MELPEHTVIVVHGGMRPGVPARLQDERDLVHLRTIRRSDSRAAGYSWRNFTDSAAQPWGRLWSGPEHAIFGHDAPRRLQRFDHATGIDTGVVFGGELTACLLPGRKLVHAAATELWCKPRNFPSVRAAASQQIIRGRPTAAATTNSPLSRAPRTNGSCTTLRAEHAR